MKKLSLVFLFVLSACGGGGGGHTSSGDGDGGTPPVGVVDSFVAKVLELIGASSDSTEPAATDALVATVPDNTEPAAVK